MCRRPSAVAVCGSVLVRRAPGPISPLAATVMPQYVAPPMMPMMPQAAPMYYPAPAAANCCAAAEPNCGCGAAPMYANAYPGYGYGGYGGCSTCGGGYPAVTATAMVDMAVQHLRRSLHGCCWLRPHDGLRLQLVRRLWLLRRLQFVWRWCSSCGGGCSSCGGSSGCSNCDGGAPAPATPAPPAKFDPTPAAG